jgi:hypothetical protein
MNGAVERNCPDANCAAAAVWLDRRPASNAAGELEGCAAIGGLELSAHIAVVGEPGVTGGTG